MNQQPATNRLTVANQITILRILGVPVFILMVLYYDMSVTEGAARPAYRWAALALFSVVALTDALDGYIARSRNQVTEIGKILDPLADKALLLSALILLTLSPLAGLRPRIPVWFALLVISRDVLLVLGAVLIRVHTGRVRVHPRYSGKIATFLQMLLIVWVLAGGPVAPFPALVWAAGFFTLLAGASYFVDGIRQLETRPSPAAEEGRI